MRCFVIADENVRLVSEEKERKGSNNSFGLSVRQPVFPQWEIVQFARMHSVHFTLLTMSAFRRVPRIICRTAVSLPAFRTAKLLFIRRTLAGFGASEGNARRGSHNHLAGSKSITDETMKLSRRYLPTTEPPSYENVGRPRVQGASLRAAAQPLQTIVIAIARGIPATLTKV